MDAQQYDWEIEGKGTVLRLRLKEVWEFRDLLMLLVRRDFVSFYKQTVLGPLWFFIQPLLTTVMFTFVFGRLGGFGTDGIPQPLFYLAGVTTWNYFADCLSKTSTVFKDNSHIFGKVYFPRLIMPMSIVISNLVKFGTQLLLLVSLLAFYVFYKGVDVKPNAHLLLFPYLVILMALQGLGAGLIITGMTTKYRDLAFLVNFGVQLLMYATTVVYPLSSADEGIRWIVEANPMTAIIETFRYGLFGNATFSWKGILYSSSATLVIFLTGLLVFNRVERTFVDTV
jgi:lipopolysaccharide transport system permease protein